jgi:glutamyl/glutaminyl-tRNA synthetase
MDMMKIRIHFYGDLLNHTYFFEEPTYDTPRAQKFLRKLSNQPNETKCEILNDLITILKSGRVDANNDIVSADEINKICSMYLYENKDRQFKNEDVFFLLRFAITGNPVGAPTGEICEVIGFKQILSRCRIAVDYLKTI